MKLIKIEDDIYDEYRINAMFDCYKWDPQFLDNNTLARYVLILSNKEHKILKNLTEDIDKETINAEKYLNNHLNLIKNLNLPKKITKLLYKMSNYDSKKNIRLMRYDFHFTDCGWMISEVNSDVPGGFAESSLLPLLAKNTLKLNEYKYIDFSNIFISSIISKVKKFGNIMLVHCTSYSDDRQVMQFLGDQLEKKNFNIIYGAADNISFKNREAYCTLNNNECKLDCIIRFTPLEWLKDIKTKDWYGYFDTITPSCNHPIAIFAQTKRFPLIWNLIEKDVTLNNWKKLLPDTVEAEQNLKEGYIYKPACGRVGEKISIKESCTEKEYKEILNDVKKHKKNYIMQKKFNSIPIETDDGKFFHICLGSYTVDGIHAGYYARISEKNRIDSDAADIPVLIGDL